MGLKSVLRLAPVTFALIILVTSPASAQLSWQKIVGNPILGDGFGDSNNTSALSSAVFAGVPYIGTGNTTTGTEVFRLTSGDWSWTQVNSDGFGGDSWNAYSMAVFNNYLYVGTWRDTFVAGDPMKIWRSNNGTIWTQVGGDSFGEAGNCEPYSMAVFNNHLYVSVSNHMYGAQIWRTLDGTNWSKVLDFATIDADNYDIPAMAVFGGMLYAGTYRGTLTGLEMWATANGTSWSQVNTNGFGNADNHGTFAMAAFNGYLYVATYNWDTGLEVWRSPGGAWSQVVSNGFGDGSAMGAFAMMAHQGALYLATQNGSGTTVWRTFDGTDWHPASKPGFGDVANQSVTTMFELDNGLYAGTFNPAGGELWRLPVLFSDGFESGNTSRWSVTVR
jgi:hypothetical protein